MKALAPGARLRKIRKEVLDLSQMAMAAKLSVPSRTYQRYESGETKKVPADVMARAETLAARHLTKRGA